MIHQIKNLNNYEDSKNEGDICSDIEGGFIATQIVRVNANKMHCKQDLSAEVGQNIKQATNILSQDKLCSVVEIPNELQLQQDGKEMNQCETYQKQHHVVVFVNEFNKFNQREDEQAIANEIKQDKQSQQQEENNNQNQHNVEIQHGHLHSDKQDDENACRICLDSESSEETGEILNICECKGSLKYIHRICLWMQLSSKVKLDQFEKNDQKFKCELCKTQYRIQVGLRYTLLSFQKFKESLRIQLRPIIIFSFLAVISTIFSVLLVNFINNEGITKKKSAIGFMYYLFASFVITTSFISFIVLFVIVIKASLLKKVSLLQVFQTKEDFQKFQLRSRSRTSLSTVASVQTQELIVVQRNPPQAVQVHT